MGELESALDIEATREHAWVDLVCRIHDRPGARLGMTVTRLDDDCGARIGTPVPTGAQPKGIAVGEAAVWVANAGDCTISRIAR